VPDTGGACRSDDYATQYMGRTSFHLGRTFTEAPVLSVRICNTMALIGQQRKPPITDENRFFGLLYSRVAGCASNRIDQAPRPPIPSLCAVRLVRKHRSGPTDPAAGATTGTIA
jgi:hypothetical protein